MSQQSSGGGSGGVTFLNNMRGPVKLVSTPTIQVVPSADGNIMMNVQSSTQAFSYSLSSADLLGMYPTPLVIMPAIPGKIIAVSYISMIFTAGSNPYSSIGGILNLQYTGTGVVDQMQNSIFTGGDTETILPGDNQPLYRSEGLQLVQSAAALTGGNGTAVLHIYYNVLS